MSELQIIPLSAAEVLADRRCWEIYEASFLANEREPPAVIARGIQAGVALMIIARERGITVGLASLHLLMDPAAVFLVYLALGEEHRGRGLGGPFLEAALTYGKERLRVAGRAPQGWVCEVALPPSNKEAIRQHEGLLRFYARQGAALLPIPYIQPPVDGASFVPMDLLFCPETGCERTDPETATALIRAIYREKYGAINGISPEALDQCLRMVKLPNQ